ncbi:glutathione transferase GstA [Pseudomonas lalucatii]|uniref:Glutathione transferase GstA n=1 Tax=Pseudomonas lalucatii TaxID=1424203 RepID=A0ABS5Q4X6_9PSED|nr:glutathione transferase GstA [Pseudomonas lalucatii]MBS7663619.1 glutathione transferase GstA [Pseudomonas lalucatii]MBS7725119.1 glutathione transferase GstA [Pseudomonas lalucatii]QVM86913.1 glutathione transferase GstA [Pseudomonas lalucatii]
MKLFYKAGACSLSPHIALYEAGVSFATEAVDLQSKRTAGGADYLAINPKGYVPALLLDSGELLSEGPAIVQYIADLVPEKHLAPTNGSLERYRLQGWLNFVGSELQKSCGAFFNPMAKDDWKRAARVNLERRLTHLDDHLQDRDYLVGERFSVADGYLFTALRWIAPIGLDLARWPHLLAFFQRIGQRPSVRAALTAEGLG